MQLKFLLQSLWHYRNARLGVLAGTIVGATVLLGALLAGDSVNSALKRLASLRVGQAEYVFTAGDRFVSEALSDEIEANLELEAAPVLMLRGSAGRTGVDGIAPQIQAIGVDARFWEFAPASDVDVPLDKRSSVAVNQRLAERLQLSEGDAFILRIEKPGLLSRDAPLSGSKDNMIGIRVTVTKIVSDDEFGRFGLQASQLSPFTLFASLSWLQEQIDYAGRVNLVLLRPRERGNGPIDSDAILSEIAPLMSLADYGLSVIDVPLAESSEIRSERVFLDEAMVAAIESRIPESSPHVTYLANTLATRDRDTPYSMVTAVGASAASILEGSLESGEAAISQWLADDLEAEVGDPLDIGYYVVDSDSHLIEETRSFRIGSIFPLEGLAADALWMPDFPGVAGAEDSSDWDAGMPLDLDRIRDKDEDYWDDYNGAPKAFIALSDGVDQWANRWGAFTALRIHHSIHSKSEVERLARSALDPRMIGAQTISFRESALNSASSPVDIGGLFISMSFFLIVAALSLIGMLFSFSMQQVNRENALLSSLGISERRIYRWRLLDALVVVSLGSLLALPLAYGYTFGILRFLETIWSGDSVGTLFGLSVSIPTIAGGVIANVVLALGTIWFVLRKQSKTQASFRLQQGSVEDVDVSEKRGLWSIRIGSAGLAGGICALGLALMGKLPVQVGYFLVGFLWLIGGLGICSFRFRQIRSIVGSVLSPKTVGCLNNGRRPLRSLTVVGTLACGVFLVVSVAAFRKEKDTSADDPKNGFGGYTYWAETSIPLSDPDDYAGESNLFDIENSGAILPIRSGLGDDASCFNLNQTANPRLLALSSEKLAERDAFTFHSIKDGLSKNEGWRLLSSADDPDVVPAFVDSATLQWALKRSLGDRLSYIDGNGRPFEIELVGAISDTLFQGSLLIDEEAFLEKFPQHEGYEIFLLDDWSDRIEEKRARIESLLGPWGGQVEVASERLQSFHEVENTYIAIFHVLGGLGVILGSAGLGVVVARNLSERRHEFALLDAMGISAGVRKKIVVSELKSLIGWGMGIGLVAAIVSIIPSLKHLGVAAPFLNLAVLLIAIVANAVFWSYIAYRRNVSAITDLQRDFDS